MIDPGPIVGFLAGALGAALYVGCIVALALNASRHNRRR
jgi:hypothetical protein